jgi:sugar phosphate permease
VVLATGMVAQASTSTFFQGLASIGPVLRERHELSLGQLGLVLGAPMAGFVLTLLPWGMASDLLPERVVIASGLAATSAFLVLAAQVDGLWPLCVALTLAGAAGASVNAASGRAVLRWFAPERRGLAMGLRQTSVPLGAALAATTLPFLVTGVGGVSLGFGALAAFCLVSALLALALVREPPAASAPAAAPVPAAGADERERDRRRAFRGVVAASTCLVVGQTVFVAFVVEMLHGERSVSLHAAGLVFAAAQVLGASARVVVGTWSDHTPDRLSPLRLVAAVTAAGMLVLALVLQAPLPVLLPVTVIVGAATICWNGVAFTAAGELAPPGRTGRSLGLQSTANYLVASLTPYVFGTLISAAGFAVGFAVVAIPAAAAGLLLSGPFRGTASRTVPTGRQT